MKQTKYKLKPLNLNFTSLVSAIYSIFPSVGGILLNLWRLQYHRWSRPNNCTSSYQGGDFMLLKAKLAYSYCIQADFPKKVGWTWHIGNETDNLNKQGNLDTTLQWLEYISSNNERAILWEVWGKAAGDDAAPSIDTRAQLESAAHGRTSQPTSQAAGNMVIISPSCTTEY